MTEPAPPRRLHPRALSAEHRSPRAAAFDPPAMKAEWIVAQALPLDGFLRELRERVGADDAFERLLRHGGVHLDRKRLCDFDEPPISIREGTHVLAYWFEREPEALVLPEGRVLHDAHGLVAIDKPPWWTTQGTRASRFASLERALREALDCPWLTPINRIDRETSGVLLYARDSRAASEAGKQFAARTVRKEYLAVVRAEPDPPDAWEVRGPMARIPHPSHSLFSLLPDGAEGDWSATRFATVARGPGIAVVTAEPLTGRTHQIRVHLAARGMPIVGDSLYGTGWQPEHPQSADRMLLHARAITLRIGGSTVRIEAPVPADFPLLASDASPSRAGT